MSEHPDLLAVAAHNNMMEEFRKRDERMRLKAAAPTYEERRGAEDKEKRDAALKKCALLKEVKDVLEEQ
jgi:hypothetical protein